MKPLPQSKLIDVIPDCVVSIELKLSAEFISFTKKLNGELIPTMVHNYHNIYYLVCLRIDL